MWCTYVLNKSLLTRFKMEFVLIPFPWPCLFLLRVQIFFNLHTRHVHGGNKRSYSEYAPTNPDLIRLDSIIEQ